MFRCTQVQAISLGLPHSLEKVAKSLKLKDQKLEEGKSLIRFFMKEENIKLLTSKEESEAKRNVIKEYEKFKYYCKKDVEVERSIKKALSKIELIESEQKLWELDQTINDRGVLVDKELVDAAIIIDKEIKEVITEKVRDITKLKNPNSTKQFKDYLNNKGMVVNSISKENMEKLLEKEYVIKSEFYEEVKEAVELKLILSKTSIKKYEAMQRCLGKDNRIRGLFQFYGASKTGRWSGRLVQVQNLPQNKIENLDEARKVIKKYNELKLPSRNKYNRNNVDKTIQNLSKCIRTTFIPKQNHKLIISDFSAIEARIIAYISNEKWRIDVFNSHGKIYEASAAKMFKVDIEKITKESELRQKGKMSEVALGYQGGKNALIKMGATKMGIKEEELENIVKAFRLSNPNIVKLWKEVEKAFIKAVKDKTIVHIGKGISFIYERNILFIKLPSKRKLAYIRPRLEYDYIFNKYIITYEGIDSTTKKLTRLKTYGGKLVENIVQAIARDVLAYAMTNLDKHGYNIVMHIHDEVVLEVPINTNIKDINKVMEQEIPYLKNLNIKADTIESKYYKK